ncbi:hypothetical protein C9374_002589 [Naegleria lovaniensis]|uniref:Uncharacterized protein n=1 Tax=Naegleria lovaniensis TaxID=51637 RepID=A0AA88GUA6_NAELO|nr:uncharacterized protein C9374_002589 [Naegleria lovaniensis]KAG2386143.1 hypothetical protein C9374_002589 [Naegleria lovaniensis]
MNQPPNQNVPPEITPEMFKQLEKKFIPRIILKTGAYGFTLATILLGSFYALNALTREDYQYLDTVSYHRDIKIKEFKQKYFQHHPGLIPTPHKMNQFIEKIKEGELPKQPSESNQEQTKEK